MPRFVILEHDLPSLHWDFMLESNDCLLTWRLDRPPSIENNIAAIALADHRVIYLDYEGEISGGRGRVRRWDRGDYTWVRRNEDELAVELFGDRLRCRAHLCKDASGDWRLKLIVDDEGDGASPS